MSQFKIKVGVDYRSALVNREGIGRYTRELVRALLLLEDDFDLSLFGFTFAKKKFTSQQLGIAGTKAQLERMRIPSRFLPWIMKRMKRGADDLLGGCHIYHHTQPNLLDISNAIEVATIFDCIYTLDAGYMEPAAAERMTQVAFRQVRRAKRILVPCQFVGAEVVMGLGAHPGSIVVTQLGCEHVLRHMPKDGFPKAKDPYLLTVCRVDPRKNHLRILQAFELLVRDGYPQRWVIAGPRGWRADIFEQALADSPARKRVQWLGDVSEAELTKLYSQADALLFPSLNEGFGLPPLESMACGTPVVTSPITATGEICEGAAMMVEPTDVEDIYLATKKLLDNRDIYDELVGLGRERAAEYNWERCAKQTLMAYQGTVMKRGDGDPKLHYHL
ncbi:MAG: glycosyltransferase involved in cell wall biosynthesis [Planctomycetota bacterium]